MYHTPRCLSAEIPPLLAKQKVTCTIGNKIENFVNILPKCKDFTVNPLEENVKEHWNLPLQIVTKNQPMKTICNFFGNKRKEKESIDQPQKL